VASGQHLAAVVGTETVSPVAWRRLRIGVRLTGVDLSSDATSDTQIG
jgi:hypothetical protein